MPTPANAINATASGILGFNGTSFTGSALTQYNVLVGGSSTNLISNVASAASGTVLQSGGGAANPSFSTGTYPSTGSTSGKILLSNGTNWVASTAQYPNAASTSGKAIISDGTNFVMSTPTFPNVSATNRKIIVSDGTNWVASTETYATPGTSGNVMTSDGTNWTSAASNAGSLSSVQVTLTNAQLKAATAVQLLAAQGAGTVIIPTATVWKFKYGGTNAFTNAPGQQLTYGSTYNTNTVCTNWGSTTFWRATASRYYENVGSTGTIAASSLENTAIYSTMSMGATGNAANDNTVVVFLFYYVITL